MKRIRIGKDISMRWEITTDGVAIPLDGRDLTVEIKSPMGIENNIPYRVEGNILIMTYYGYEQKRTGEYSITLWEKKGKPGQNVVDVIRAFKLVETSQEEDDFVGGDLQIESVDLGTENFDILTEGGYRAINIDTLQAEALEDSVNINGKTYSNESFTITLPKANLDSAGVMGASDVRTLKEHADSIAQIKTSCEKNASDISVISDELGTLNSQVDANAADIASLNTEVSAMQSKVDENTTSISQINNNIADNNKSIAQINTTLEEHTESIKANITTDRIEDGAVTSEKIATSAFDDTLSVSGKIAPADVVGEKITDLGEQTDNPEFVRVVVDKDGKFLYGVEKNGNFKFGAGIPKQVQDRIAQIEEELSKKVTLEEGKELLDSSVARSLQYIDNSEYMSCTTDEEGKIIEAITKYGLRKFFLPLDIKGNIVTPNFNPEYIYAITDKKGKVVFGILNSGNIEISNIPKVIKKYIDGKTKTYKKMLDAFNDDCTSPFILGSQFVNPVVSSYDKNVGERNTYMPEKVSAQFAFPTNIVLPDKRIGMLQTFLIDGVEATVKNFGDNYVFLKKGSDFYRIPYTDKSGTVDVTDSCEKINVGNLNVHNLYETADGNMLADCAGNPSQFPHSLYKLTITSIDTEVHTSSRHLFTFVGDSTVETDWSIKQYGNKILVSPYAHGRTAQLWLSEDYGNTFSCIFNIADDTTYVATKPKEDGSYGAVGIHPVPPNLVPPRPSDFWDLAAVEGNGNMHIHSNCYDEYFDRIWIVCGDDGGARVTGIYYTDDKGITWNRISVMSDGSAIDYAPMRGNMQMLQVIAMPNCVLFGTDGWGSGIFRYNRGKKDEVPVIEFAYGFTSDHGSTVSVAQSTLMAGNGVALMSYAPDRGSNPRYSPTGGVVATDGYHFKEILTDTYNEGTQTTIRLHWHIPMKIVGSTLYIMCSNAKEIMFAKYNF